jgi:hypothetical protein
MHERWEGKCERARVSWEHKLGEKFQLDMKGAKTSMF